MNIYDRLKHDILLDQKKSQECYEHELIALYDTRNASLTLKPALPYSKTIFVVIYVLHPKSLP